MAWGIHLSSVGIFYDTPDIENAKSSFYTVVRVVVIISWIVSSFFYMKFLKTQDELVIRWNEFMGSWGAIGFEFWYAYVTLVTLFRIQTWIL